MQQFKDHDSDRPDVVFGGVDVLLEGLGGHIKWASDIIFLLLRLVTELNNAYYDFLAKPKSAIFATPLSFIRMLASLRSRCRNLFSPISRYPMTISFMIERTSLSGRRFLFLR